MRRVVVVGTSGSGKTTLAGRLADMLGVAHVELDALHWEADWQEADVAVFRSRVEKALESDSWVVDGNYSRARDIVWSKADTVVWLDYPLSTILSRLFTRTFRRAFTQEQLWNGNRENLRSVLFGKESLFLWAIQTYSRRRAEYSALFKQPEYAHLRLIRTASAAETDTWLKQLQV